MLAWACIAPHGGEQIPNLAGTDIDRMAVTLSTLVTMATNIGAAAPETIRPHTAIAERRQRCMIGEYPLGESAIQAIGEQSDLRPIP